MEMDKRENKGNFILNFNYLSAFFLYFVVTVGHSFFIKYYTLNSHKNQHYILYFVSFPFYHSYVNDYCTEANNGIC